MESKIYEYNINGEVYQFEYNSWFCDTANEILHSVEQVKPSDSTHYFMVHNTNHDCIRELYKYIDLIKQ